MEKEYQDLLDQAAGRSTTDLEFRVKLLKDAPALINNEYGKKLPFQVTFHESSEKNLVFILPISEEEELNLDDLDQVAGGTYSSSEGYATSAYGMTPDGGGNFNKG